MFNLTGKTNGKHTTIRTVECTYVTINNITDLQLYIHQLI